MAVAGKAEYVLRMIAKHGLAPRATRSLPQAFALCRGRANEWLHFKLADIRHEEGASFDLMLVMDVLEHLPGRPRAGALAAPGPGEVSVPPRRAHPRQGFFRRISS